MRLPIFAFIHRFLQHVLPCGFMKVRYFGFLSPSFKIPIEQIKARIELAQGFELRPPSPIEMTPPQPLRCPHCGARLRYRCTILPRTTLRDRIKALIIRTVQGAMSETLGSGP